MDVLVVFVALAVVIFGAAFLARRRFGLLALALTAGSVLSDVWGYDAGLMVGVFGVNVSSLSTTIILMTITLLPAVILLFHGYTYKTVLGRIVGASLFTILTLAFLVQPIGHILPVQGFGAVIYRWLISSHDLIIGVGLIIAVIDLFLTRPVTTFDRRSKH